MNAKQVFFFGTSADMAELIESIESKKNLIYHKAGLLEENELVSFSSLINANIGTTEYGENNLCPAYIVVESGTDINIRTVPQRAGGEKLAIDQATNPASIYFRPGGSYKSEAIIEGKCGTISTDEKSQDIFNLFSQELKTKFKKNKGYFIGKEALESYYKEVRLTQNVKSPLEYDFQPETTSKS